MDRYVEMKKYVEAQIKIFKVLPFRSDFNDGIIEGLNLVKVYLDKRIESEGANIAEELNGYKN